MSPPRHALAALVILLGACGPSSPATDTPASDPATVASAKPPVESSAAVASASGSAPAATPPEPDQAYVAPTFSDPPPIGQAPAPLAKSTRDPKIVSLVKAVSSCKKTDFNTFDYDCPRVRKLIDEEKLFADGKGNATLLSMLEDEDLKIRQAASVRNFYKPAEFFADTTNARHVMHAALKEQDPLVGRRLGELASYVDAEKASLQGEMVALTKHSLKEIRSAIAFYLLGHNPSSFNLQVAQRLMVDSDARIQETAVGSLSTGGITKGTDEVCKVLSNQLRRKDKAGVHAHWDAATSNCGSVFPQLIASLEKRVQVFDEEAGMNAVDYSLAASGVCHARPKFDEETTKAYKKRAFEIGKILAGTKLSDMKINNAANGRNAAMSVLVECDPSAARPILEELTKDKDSFVADRAKDYLSKAK